MFGLFLSLLLVYNGNNTNDKGWEDEIMKDEYILFLDETKPAPKNPYFCLAGFAIKRSDYENELIPKINVIKKEIFNDTSIVFHYNEIKNNKGDFSILKDAELRNKFWQNITHTLSELDLHVFGVYYNRKTLTNVFGNGATTQYDIAFRHLLDNYMHFCKKNDAHGHICIESRTFIENSKLQEMFFNYLTHGSSYYKSEIIKKHLTSIGFLIKGDNCIGLQIADIVPVRLMRMVNKLGDNYKIGEILVKKLYKAENNKHEDVLGLTKIM